MPFTTLYPGPHSVLVMDNCRIHHGEHIHTLVEDVYCKQQSGNFFCVLMIIQSASYSICCRTRQTTTQSNKPFLPSSHTYVAVVVTLQ